MSEAFTAWVAAPKADRLPGQIADDFLTAGADPHGIDQHAPGAKLDAGKAMAGLLLDFGPALLAVAEVSTYGAKKYTRGGWKSVPDAGNRYTDAMMRHLLAEATDERDGESRLRHAAHAAWNALARLHFIIQERGK